MGRDVAGSNDEWEQRRRHRSALLSLIAALVTALIMVPKGLSESLLPWQVFWFRLAAATVGISVAAAIQYRWFRYSGAGAAAAFVYWMFVFFGEFDYGTAVFIGAVLQTFAWAISRPGRPTPARDSQERASHNR